MRELPTLSYLKVTWRLSGVCPQESQLADSILTLPTAPSCCLTSSHLLVSVQATWLAYDMVVMRTNPTLAESMHRLEDAFLNCKEEMEKNWQDLLSEIKLTQ